MAEKKGLIYRLTMGRDNNPDYTVDKLPSNRWQVFKDVMGQRFGALFKINLLMLIFCVPLIIWLIFNSASNRVLGATLPFSTNIGIGYPAIGFVNLLADRQFFFNELIMWAGMIPCIMIASIGLAGGFHTIKLLVWGEGISVVQTFFKGIKNNILTYLLLSFIIGLFIFIIAFNLNAYKVIKTKDWLLTLGSVVSIISLVFLLFMAMYMTTQAVTYKLKLWGLIKNSFIFSIAMLFHNILFLVLSMLPVIVLLIFPAVGVIIGIFYALLGLSMTILIWTIATHYVYDKFLNDKIEGAIKDRGIYRKKIEREEKEKEASRKFSNPKKRKKKVITSIDEGKSFTPLGETFSRADLARMQEEKEEVKKEIEAELVAAENAEEDDEIMFSEIDAENDESAVDDDSDFDVSDLEALEGVSAEELAALESYNDGEDAAAEDTETAEKTQNGKDGR